MEQKMKKVSESSLSRLWNKTQENVTAAITAFRGGNTRDENRTRNKELMQYLIGKGYSVTKIQGNYIEDFGTDDAKEVGEESFFVAPNGKDSEQFINDIIKLGQYYEQDSVLIIPEGGEDAYLYGTNDSDFPGKGEKVVTGNSRFGRAAGQFLSRIKGRAFAFETVEPPQTVNGKRFVSMVVSRVNENMKQINEASLSRVWQHAESDRPIALITAFRGEYDLEENKRRNKELAATIRKMGYGFFFVDGYWIENQGTPEEVHVSEDSIFVIAPEDTDTKFREQMTKLADYYNQDGVLIKDKEGAKVYTGDGNVMFDVGTLKPGKAGEIYTRLRNNKKSNTFVFESERDDLGWLQRLAGINK